MAIEDLNAKGGVLGRPLKMMYRDTKSDIAGGAVAARNCSMPARRSSL